MILRPARTSALLRHSSRAYAVRLPLRQARHASFLQDDPSITDPNMNGGYVNPPPVKRALRDPYGDWWDKQERRNFGEPVHEDNDILAVFSTEPYTHASMTKASVSFMCFVAAALGLVGTVYMITPEKPSAPRTFPGGLEEELGGKGALLALAPSDGAAEQKGS